MSSDRGASFGIVDGLLLLFIGLKLAGFIDWSWWWVLSPYWIYFLLIILFGKK